MSWKTLATGTAKDYILPLHDASTLDAPIGAPSPHRLRRGNQTPRSDGGEVDTDSIKVLIDGVSVRVWTSQLNGFDTRTLCVDNNLTFLRASQGQPSESGKKSGDDQRIRVNDIQEVLMRDQVIDICTAAQISDPQLEPGTCLAVRHGEQKEDALKKENLWVFIVQTNDEQTRLKESLEYVHAHAPPAQIHEEQAAQKIQAHIRNKPVRAAAGKMKVVDTIKPCGLQDRIMQSGSNENTVQGFDIIFAGGSAGKLEVSDGASKADIQEAVNGFEASSCPGQLTAADSLRIVLEVEETLELLELQRKFSPMGPLLHSILGENLKWDVPSELPEKMHSELENCAIEKVAERAMLRALHSCAVLDQDYNRVTEALGKLGVDTSAKNFNLKVEASQPVHEEPETVDTPATPSEAESKSKTGADSKDALKNDTPKQGKAADHTKADHTDTESAHDPSDKYEKDGKLKGKEEASNSCRMCAECAVQ